jgi:hypothetical protein
MNKPSSNKDKGTGKGNVIAERRRSKNIKQLQGHSIRASYQSTYSYIADQSSKYSISEVGGLITASS